MAKETLVRRYLLGALPEDERQRVEDQYFSKSDRFEELIAVENDLVDSYVRQKLSSSEAREFENNYLSSPERRARVDFARSLMRACSEFAPPQPQRESEVRKVSSHVLSARFPAWQWAAAFAAVLVMASGIWLIVQERVERTGLREAQSQRQAPPATGIKTGEPKPGGKMAPEQAIANAPPENPEIAATAPEAHVLTFTLNSEAVRGAVSGGNHLTITPEVSSVIFCLPIASVDYSTYQAELQTVDEQTLLSSKNLISRRSDGQIAIYFRVPAARLSPGDYIVRLRGKDGGGRTEEIQAYSFRVLLK